MNLKTNFQYTYFVYPYIISEKLYNKYLLKLLKNKKCHLKIFQKEKDLEIYNYFSENIKNYMFSSFNFDKAYINNLNKLEKDKKLKANLLSKFPSVMFEYDIGKDIQGKVGTENGIFFNITKIEIICFKTGICFLTLKTHLQDNENFSDVLNFNYKFKDIISEYTFLKDYENINIQTNVFDEVENIKDVIEELTAQNSEKKKIDNKKFYLYAYSCIDADSWNASNDFSNIEGEFLKYVYALPNNYNSNFNIKNENNKIKTFSNYKYIRSGITKTNSAIITSSIDTFNYTILPHLYENQYLYTAIIALYQKMYIQDILKNTNTKCFVEKLKEFTETIWKVEITNDVMGNEIYNNYFEILELDKIYNELNEKFEIMYKSLEILKNKKINKLLIFILSISFFINVLTLILIALFLN